MPKRFLFLVLGVLLSTGLAQANPEKYDSAPMNDLSILGPGDGGGDDSFDNCYRVHKSLHECHDVTAGEYFEYRIKVWNICGVPLRHARFLDSLPPIKQGTFSFDTTKWSCVAGGTLPNDANVKCRGVLAPYDESTFRLRMKTPRRTRGWIFNNACLWDKHFGGYTCHGIWAWVKAPTQNSTPAKPADPIRDGEGEIPIGNDGPEDLL